MESPPIIDQLSTNESCQLSGSGTPATALRTGASFLLALLWGAFVAGFFGWIETGKVAKHLGAKGVLLAGAGLPHLPGAIYWEEMATTSPQLAGAVFFALSLGVGLATLAFLWARVVAHLPRIGWGVLLAPLFIFPCWALFRGDLLAALITGIIPLGAAICGLSPGKSTPRGLATALVIAVILFTGFVPWFSANTAVLVRDRLLLGTDMGKPVSDAYYRWTLYPAETIKPLHNLTQPVVAVSDTIKYSRFCYDAAKINLLCVPLSDGGDGGGYDLLLLDTPELEITDGSRSFLWPGPGGSKRLEGFRAFSRAADRNKVLRRATFYSFWYGGPLAILMVLLISIQLASSILPAKRTHAALAMALVIAGATTLPAFPTQWSAHNDLLINGNPSPGEIAVALSSEDRIRRMYGVKAAGSRGMKFLDEIVAALDDEVVNVRYTAARALGRINADSRSERAREALIALIHSDDEWYVKNLAYWALLNAGWRPTPWEVGK